MNSGTKSDYLFIQKDYFQKKTELQICEMEQQLSEILHTDDLVCLLLLALTDFAGFEAAADYFWDTDENGHRIHKFIKIDQLCFLCSLPFEDHHECWNGQLIEDPEVKRQWIQ